MAEQMSENAIAPMLNSTLAVYRSSPVIGRSLTSDASSCEKYLASLRKRMMPFLELVSAGTESGVNGTWECGKSDNLRDDGVIVDVHTVKFPVCKFMILVSSTAGTKEDAQLIIFSRSSKQLNSVFIKWVELYLDVLVRQVKFDTPFSLRFVDEYILASYRNEDTTSTEIEFSTDVTEANRITLAFESEDVGKFARSGKGTVERLLAHVRSSTGIKFQELSVSRVSCRGGVLSTEGKMKLVSGLGQEWRLLFAENWIAEVAKLVWR
ncbi:uncharacterized protein V2V93DRAFT_372752 [Kockiozyma suomiensis]|uniref:uncharacterized protein n=1 Tax=Kockiozyma suomiensis TaxID=1337062 RepID=UPI0033433A1A